MLKLREVGVSAILKLLAFNAFVIVGWFFATRKDSILQPVGDRIRKLPENLAKPLSECPNCMSSVWGSLVYWTHYDAPLRSKLRTWPFYILGLCGVMELISWAKPQQEKQEDHARS